MADMADVMETVDGWRWDLYARVEVIGAGARIRLTINHDERVDRSTEICKVELPIEFATEICKFAEEISAALAFAINESEGA